MPLSLLRDLALIGARGGDDAPLASGTATFYEPGTTTLATVWKDADGNEAWAQPIALDETGKATVWTDGPVRMLAQGADLVTVLDEDPANTALDKDVAVTSTEWDGPYLRDSLDALAASLGGQNGGYRETSENDDFPIHDWMGQLVVNVRTFGARGDGQASDQLAVDSAYAHALAHIGEGGRGVIYFPPGNYRLSQAFALRDSGLVVRGAGIDLTTLTFYTADSDGLSITASVQVEDLTVAYDGFSTGAGIRIVDASRVKLIRVGVAPEALAGWLYGATVVPTTVDCETIDFEGCEIRAEQAASDTTSVGLKVTLGGSFTVKDLHVVGGSLESVGSAQVQVQVGTGVVFDRVKLVGPSYGIYLGAFGYTVDGVSISHCDFRGRTSALGDVYVAATSTDNVKTWGNSWRTGAGVLGVTDAHVASDPGIGNIYGDVSQNPVGQHGSVETGIAGTYVPDLDVGNYFKLTASNDVVVGAPTSSYAKRPGQQIIFELAGGFGFTFNAVFVGFLSQAGIQVGIWNGTSWVAQGEKSSVIQTLTPVPGTTQAINLDNGHVIVVNATNTSSGAVTIGSPTGSAQKGTKITFILTSSAAQSGWTFHSDYSPTARTFDDTPLGLNHIGNNGVDGFVGTAVVDFVYDGTLWLVPGASRQTSDVGGVSFPSVQASGTVGSPTVSPATVTPNLDNGRVVRIYAKLGTGELTIANPTGNYSIGSRFVVLMSVDAASGTVVWTLGNLYVVSGHPGQSVGFPVAANQHGSVEFIWDGGYWVMLDQPAL